MTTALFTAGIHEWCNRILQGPALHFDLPILDWIQSNLRCAALDTIFPLITQLGSALATILIGLVLLAIPKTRRVGFSVCLSLACCGLFCNLLLKPLIGRIRPYDLQELLGMAQDLHLLIAPPHDFSFPSGHTVASFATASAIFHHDKRFGIPALVLAAIIGFSRLYLYVHYVTDVLFGVVFGVLFGCLGVWTAKKLLALYAAHKEKKHAS